MNAISSCIENEHCITIPKFTQMIMFGDSHQHAKMHADCTSGFVSAHVWFWVPLGQSWLSCFLGDGSLKWCVRKTVAASQHILVQQISKRSAHWPPSNELLCNICCFSAVMQPQLSLHNVLNREIFFTIITVYIMIQTAKDKSFKRRVHH